MSPTSLLDLPAELQLQIISECNWPAKQLLRTVCRYYRTIIPALTVAQLEIVEAEAHAYLCHSCHCIRRASKFEDRMLAKGRYKRFFEKDKAGIGSGTASTDDDDWVHTRFCIDCGLDPASPAIGQYPPGIFLVVQRARRILCVSCGSLGTPGPKRAFWEHGFDYWRREEQCEACWEARSVASRWCWAVVDLLRDALPPMRLRRPRLVRGESW